jgi:dipeptidyl aminopeptidase/acylaminoacyl peptidase
MRIRHYVLLALALLLAAAAPASATFPGQNGRIAIGTNDGIVSVKANGKDLRREPGTGRHDWWPLWSPDGKSLAFQRERAVQHTDDPANYPPGETTEGNLWVRPPGGKPVRIHHADYHDPCGTPSDYPIGWSADRTAVLAHHSGWDGEFSEFEPGFSDCNGGGGVFAAPLDGSQPTWYGPGHTGCRGPFPDAAAPDGRRVAGTDFCHSRYRIVVAALAPWHAKTIVKLPKDAYVDAYDWSPDGKRIVFAEWSQRDNGSVKSLGVFTVRASGGEPKRVAKRGGLPVWSPDGEKIAYIDGPGILTVRTGGGGRKRLRRVGAWEDFETYPLSLSWQPRG